MIPLWVNNYIGLAFKEHGRDRDSVYCWGLVRLVLADQFDTVLPSYAEGYESTEDAKDIGRLVRGEMDPWRQRVLGEERPGDVVLMRMMNQPMHVGVVVAGRSDGSWMLHIEDGIDASLETYDGAKWRRRVLGIYRYDG